MNRHLARSITSATMSFPVMVAGALWLLVRMAVPMCIPTEYTFYIEKPGCNYCVAVNTTICMGFCFSRDSNLKELLGTRFLIQRSCTYQDSEFRTAVLPGCAPYADPYFTYPVALSCHCSMCNTHSDECIRKTGNPSGKCTKLIQPLNLYSEDSDSNQPSLSDIFDSSFI